MTQTTNTGPGKETLQPEVAETLYSGENPEQTEEESSEEREARDESRFKEGQILRFVRVRFPGNAKSFPFLVGKRQIEYGQKVVAMSDRGMAVGYVNSFPYDAPFNKSMLPIRSIAKIATEEDIQKDQEAYHQQKDAENICNDLIEAHQLDMYLTHVEFTSFGKKAIFYFIAPSRVDFRDLVKDLVGKLKTRIELRQISVRDRSASIGGIGPCGRELCCSSFLTKYGNVGIKMAKNQDLTLNFSKLNGVCGQLKCCLQYEDEVYKEKRNRLPKEGDIISTHTNEVGRVLRLHLLSEQFDMITNRGVKKRYVVDLYKETLDKESANFPREFDSVSDETHKIVGLEESQAKKVKMFEAQVKEYKSTSKDFAQDVFENLFGVKSLDYTLPEIIDPDSERIVSYANPDDEEEVAYTPSEDELLLDDEDSSLIVDEPIITKNSRHQHQETSRTDNRHQGRSRNSRSHRSPRPQVAQGNRPENNSESGENRRPARSSQQRRFQNKDGRNRPPK